MATKPKAPTEGTLAVAFANAAATPERHSHQTCTICRLIRDLPPADSAALVAVLEGRELSAPRVARVLEAQGHKVNQQSVGHHRRGQCTTGHIYGGVQR